MLVHFGSFLFRWGGQGYVGAFFVFRGRKPKPFGGGGCGGLPTFSPKLFQREKKKIKNGKGRFVFLLRGQQVWGKNKKDGGGMGGK